MGNILRKTLHIANKDTAVSHCLTSIKMGIALVITTLFVKLPIEM